MRQRSLRFSVILSLLVLCILVATAAPAFAKKPKKRRAADEKAERLKRESEARIAALYQMAMARTNQITTPSEPAIGTMNDGGGSIVGPVTPATNAQFLADDAASVAPVVPAAGTLLISEFRLRGPGGASDEFIEIYNNSDADHTVAAISGTGYGVAASDGVLRCTIPNATVIPARGHYLCTNAVGYSYSSYPAGNGTTAIGDATYVTDIPDNAGIALFNNNTGGASFTLANRFDAVGSTAEANTLYKEGTGYPVLTPFSTDYCWVRDECGKGGSTATTGPCTISTPKDTDNNAADFFYIDTNGTPAGAGQNLGAPGPQNLSSAIQRNSTITAAFLDSTVSQASSPNRVRDPTPDPGNNSSFGTLSIRRRFVNNTGANVTLLRFRIIDISTFFAPAAMGIADLRARTSSAAPVPGINDSVTCTAAGQATPCTVTVQGTTLEQDTTAPNSGQVNGGGFNSSLGVGTVTLGTPLANGASIDVQFLLGIQQKGNFRIYVNVEALP